MAKKEKGPGKSTKLSLHSRNKRVLEGMGNHLGPPGTVAGAGMGDGGREAGIEGRTGRSQLNCCSAFLYYPVILDPQ